MTTIRYALVDELADSYIGGVIVTGDADLNVAEALKAGNGHIDVKDTDVDTIAALDEYPAVERVNVDEPATKTKAASK